MFQFRRFPSYTYWFSIWCIHITVCGLLHSDICGSRIACISPQLFAAYHVLRRLPMPRHSPCALLSLTIFSNVLHYARFLFRLKIKLQYFLTSQLIFPSIVYVVILFFVFLMHFYFFFIQFSRFRNVLRTFTSLTSPTSSSICFANRNSLVWFWNFYVPWWAQVDSNHRPHAYQACALTTWAMRPFSQYLGCSLSFSHVLWWRWGGSNSWPPACKAGALPAELHPH